MEKKLNLLKIIITIFLLLNILTLILGYILIENEFQENNLYYNQKNEEFLYREKSLLSELELLSNTKEDFNSNLKILKEKIKNLKQEINESKNSFASLEEETKYYENKLSIDINKNNLLKIKKKDLTLKLEKQQQLKKSKKKVVKRKTRSS